MEILKSPNSKYKFLLLIISVFSLNAVTVFFLAHNRVVLDHDGIFFVTLAEIIQSGDVDNTILNHRGYIYSYLIQLFANITLLDLESAAYFLNSVCFTLITFAFVAIVKEIGGTSQRIMLLSFILILFFPSISKYKSMLVRDFAYIACYLWSLFFLLKFFSTDRKVIFLFAWTVCLFVSAFFRIEGLLHLIFIGIAISLLSLNRILAIFFSLKVWAIVFFFFSIFLSVYFLAGSEVVNLYFTYWIDYLFQSFERLLNSLETRNNNVLFSMLLSLFEVLYNVARRLEFIYLLLAFFTLKCRLGLNGKHHRIVVFVYIALGIAIVTLFRVKEGFIASRYTLPFVLVILTLSPFVINELISKWSEKERWQKVAAVVFMLILIFLSLKRFEYSDRYLERAAGEWLLVNSNEQQSIASNDSKILYYADRFPFIKRGSRYYRYQTSYLHDEYKGAYQDLDFIAFYVDPDSSLDLNQERYFTSQFGLPVKTINDPYSSSSKYVHIYQLNSK